MGGGAWAGRLALHCEAPASNTPNRVKKGRAHTQCKRSRSSTSSPSSLAPRYTLPCPRVFLSLFVEAKERPASEPNQKRDATSLHPHHTCSPRARPNHTAVCVFLRRWSSLFCGRPTKHAVTRVSLVCTRAHPSTPVHSWCVHPLLARWTQAVCAPSPVLTLKCECTTQSQNTRAPHAPTCAHAPTRAHA